MQKFDYQYVKDPNYYNVGCAPSHSDHSFYRNYEEMIEEQSSFKYDLNGIWKFHYARNYQETIQGFEKKEYSCKNWMDIRVPSHIQMEGFDKPHYCNAQYPWEGTDEIIPGEIPERFNPVASYVKYFSIPSQMRGERIFLVLEGAESSAAVWVNGNYVGYHEDSFTPAEFEITSFLESGENKLSVQVFKWCLGSWFEDQDFFRFSGLYRDVYLYSIPKSHVRDLHLVSLPENDLKSGKLTVEMELLGSGEIQFILSDKNQVIYETKEVIKEKVCITKKIESLELWSCENPYLYECIINVFDGEGRLQECIREKVGFRKFEIIDSVMYLNGKRIVFKGVNRHEFSSSIGRVPSKENLIQDLRTIKQNNINAIRTSHYPNSSMLYKLCDEFGIYIMDEVNLETHGTWNPTPFEDMGEAKHIIPRNDIIWENLLIKRTESMYERDKNHPSILIWSCGNESFGGRVIYQMSEFLREKDPNRIIHYEGVGLDRSYPSTSDIESQMYISVKGIEEYLKENREKPFISCEYSHAMGNSCGALFKYTDLTDKDELYQGGFIWDYIDQTIDKKTRYGEEYQAYGGDFKDRPTDYNFSGNGLVYGDTRLPSPKMQEVKYLYQNLEILIDKNQFEVINKFLFTNTNQFECRVILNRNGYKIKEKVIKTDVEPLSRKKYELPFEEQMKKGEYTIIVSFHLMENCIWAEKGHEISFGQYVYKVEAEEVFQEKRPISVVKSRHNIGIYGDEFSTIFSLLSGGLVSYKYGGVEMLDSIPKPNFWRAPTDNDYGCLMPVRHGVWKLASLYASTKRQGEKDEFAEIVPYKIEEYDNCVNVEFQYFLPTVPESSCHVSYSVYGDGKVVTELRYTPESSIIDMPEFGMLFKVDADYDCIMWYGLGPEETYSDRKCGAKLGVYANTVMDNMALYLVPQECGNKEEVRYAKVLNKKGRGLLFEAEDGVMNFSALPYTPHQIEEAKHIYELPKVYNTVIRVSKSQMGVGGDDSWGSKTHKEFRIAMNQPLKFKFSFKGI